MSKDPRRTYAYKEGFSFCDITHDLPLTKNAINSARDAVAARYGAPRSPGYISAQHMWDDGYLMAYVLLQKRRGERIA